MKVSTSRSHRRFNTQFIKKTLESFWVQNPRSTKEAHSSLSEKPFKNVLRVPLYTRRSRSETLILNGFELLFGPT